MEPVSECAVCGSRELELRLEVSGDAGPAGLVPTTDRFGVALADIHRCGRCGHMQVSPMPSAVALTGEYAEAGSADYIEEERGQRQTARRLLAEIERYADPGRLADLGCWVGFFLDEARKRGWRVAGVEPSEFASAYAREHLGLDVRTGELLGSDLEPGLAAVTMLDVLEHLPDPGAALDRVRSLLAADGVLALTLPDAGSRVARLMGRRWWSVIPTHVHYFTRSSLTALLDAHGIEVLELRTAPKAFTAGYYLGRLGGYSGRTARLLVGVAALARVQDRVWAPDLRDRMLVIARPRAGS